MKLLIITGSVLALALLVVVGSKDTSSNAYTKPSDIQAVQSSLQTGGQLIDVRTPQEFADGHIENAINLSLQDIQAGTMPAVAKDKPVYLYCQSGNRSSQATTKLKSMGYTNIIDLGAMSKVQKMGGKVI